MHHQRWRYRSFFDDFKAKLKALFLSYAVLISVNVTNNLLISTTTEIFSQADSCINIFLGPSMTAKVYRSTHSTQAMQLATNLSVTSITWPFENLHFATLFRPVWWKWRTQSTKNIHLVAATLLSASHTKNKHFCKLFLALLLENTNRSSKQ